ncbi:MAG: hypothetical protein VX899_10290 [Myxococcota bacterium]|nr:hypothetical protein [Myxococcota bacterium]
MTLLWTLLACEITWLGINRQDDSNPSGGDDTQTTWDSGEWSGTWDSAQLPIELVELSAPCKDQGPIYALHPRSEQELWVGCGGGAGLHHSVDGGESFTEELPGADLYVFDIQEGGGGTLLACGHAYAGDLEGSLLLRRSEEGDWRSLLAYGDNREDDDLAYISNCGQVGVSGSRLMVFSNTIGDMTTSTDGGSSWTAAERYWGEANLDEGGYSAHQVLQLAVVDGDFYGSGSVIAEPPRFFMPSDHAQAQWFNLASEVVSPTVTGEAWALATPDGGASWILGGRDQDEGAAASGFLFGGAPGAWRRIPVGPEIDIVRDIAFNDDGSLGVAVGDRYPPTAKGGFVLISEDGGRSWQALDAGLPANLQRVSVHGSTFWVGGEDLLVRGSW